MYNLLVPILYLSLLSFLALISYMLVVFIYFCFNSGNILDWYYEFLLDSVKPKHPKIAKVLGLCPVCMGFWIGAGFYTISCKYLGLEPIGFLYFSAISQYALLKRFVFTDK